MIDILERLKSMKIQKNVKETFDEINKLKGEQDSVFEFLSNQSNEKGKLIKENNKYCGVFTSNKDYQSFSNNLFSLKMNLSNEDYYSNDALVTTISLKNWILQYKISISNLYRGKKSRFYRMVLPLDKELKISYLFNTNSFAVNQSGCSSELIKTYINGREFHIYKLSNDNAKYLFIDCLSEIAYQEFYDQSICILCALGILTGYFVENECFIFSSDKIDFETISFIEFRSLRDSKYAMYEILPTNPYVFFDKNEAEKNRKLMARISNDVFNRLVNKINLSLTLENSLFIFLEALSYPLDTQPACLSVVLEGLCNYVKEENEKSFKPIQEKCKWKELREKLKKVLDDFEYDFSQDGRLIIEKRIDDINNPTNRSKFEKAIELLGLNLTDYEKEVLLNRNTFLHCLTELKTEYIKIKAGSAEYNNLFFSSQILIRLLYKMILKIIGYEGHIVNILKFNEDVFESIKEEPKLIKI